jgi:hypothetical protein
LSDGYLALRAGPESLGCPPRLPSWAAYCPCHLTPGSQLVTMFPPCPVSLWACCRLLRPAKPQLLPSLGQGYLQALLAQWVLTEQLGSWDTEARPAPAGWGCLLIWAQPVELTPGLQPYSTISPTVVVPPLPTHQGSGYILSPFLSPLLLCYLPLSRLSTLSLTSGPHLPTAVGWCLNPGPLAGRLFRSPRHHGWGPQCWESRAPGRQWLLGEGPTH